MTYFLCLKPTTAPFGWHEPRDGLIAVDDVAADKYRELKHLYRECDKVGMPLDERPKPAPVEEGITLVDEEPKPTEVKNGGSPSAKKRTSPKATQK